MAQKELALYVAEQLAPLGEIRYIPMMGGWLFYYREKLIGGIYGDGFAVKDTAASRRFMPDCRDEVWAGRGMGGYSSGAAALYDSGRQRETV